MLRRSSSSRAHAYRLNRALIALALTVTALTFACCATNTPEGERVAPTHNSRDTPTAYIGAPH